MFFILYLFNCLTKKLDTSLLPTNTDPNEVKTGNSQTLSWISLSYSDLMKQANQITQGLKDHHHLFHHLARHASIPIAPTVLQSTSAECLFEGLVANQPVELWSHLEFEV